MQTITYKLDITPGGVPLTIHISQYDVGLRQYTFQPFTSDGMFSRVSGATVTLEATKPDGYAVIHSCEYNQDGSITYTLQEQLAAKPGTVWSKVVIRDGADILGTGAVVWIVDNAGVKDGAIISDSDVSALQQWVEDVGDYAAQAESSAQTAASAVESAESAATSAQAAETSAQAAATQAAGYVDQAVILGGTPLVAATVSAMSDHDRVYVYTGSETGYTAGNWYYWNGSAWTSGGIYNSSAVQTDPTLSVSGVAADAAACGKLKSGIEYLHGKKILDLTWTSGYIKASNLTYGSGGTHVYSNCVQIKAGTMLYVPRVNKSTTATLLCLCNSSGTPTQVLLIGTSTANSTGEHIMYPILEDSYVRFGGNTSMSTYMVYLAEEDFTEDYVFNEDNFALFNSVKTLAYGDGALGPSSSTVGFKRSNVICLPKGMTLEYWGCGSGYNNIRTVSKYNPVDNSYISTIVEAGSGIQHGKYTATEHMYVRLCARIAPDETQINVVLPDTLYYGWRTYYEKNHFESVKNHPLYGKNMTVMGDSLVYGNKLQPGGTWITNLGLKYNMVYTNLGDNSNPMARVSSSSETAMVDRIDTIPIDTEYFVIEGGANDKNNNVPLGDADSTNVETFNGALNSIITNVRARIPKAKFLLMTGYKRFTSRNNLDLGEEDYVNAIVEAGKRHCVPVYNNYENCGLTFLDTSLSAWIDEAKNRQQIVGGEIVYNANVQHFSVEAYQWLTTLYEHVISGL